MYKPSFLPIKVLSEDRGNRDSSSIRDNTPSGRDNNKSSTGLLSENSTNSIGIPSTLNQKIFWQKNIN